MGIPYGKLLYDARKKRGLNQARLAEMAGINPRGQAYISDIETGKIAIPGANKWGAICAILKIDPLTGVELKAAKAVSLASEQRGAYMIKDERGIWQPFNLRSDPERYEAGTVLSFKDADGTEIQVQVFCGPNGRKTVVPV